LTGIARDRSGRGIADIRTVVRQPIRRPVAFVTVYRTSIRGVNASRREQLRVTAIARDVVDIDLGTAVRPDNPAVLRIDTGQCLAALVDLERFPWIEHRAGLQIGGVDRSRRVADVDGPDADIGSRISAVGSCR